VAIPRTESIDSLLAAEAGDEEEEGAAGGTALSC